MKADGNISSQLEGNRPDFLTKWKLVEMALRDSRLGHSRIPTAILQCLIEHDGPSGCFVGRARLAELCDVDRSRITTALNRLEEQRYIRWDQRWNDKNPGDTIYDDDSCFLAVELFRELLVDIGMEHIPIMTTEGGPVHTDLWDGRYPRIMPNLFIEMLEQELAWMSDKDWYYCLCPWLWANNAAGGTGGWADCQIYHPGHPWVDSDGFMPVVRWLIERPISDDGNTTPPEEPPEPPEEPMPEPEPKITDEPILKSESEKEENEEEPQISAPDKENHF